MKMFKTRLQQKHDIQANWEKSKLVPLAGEIIVYDDRYLDTDLNEVVIVAPKVRYKIGDGFTPVNDLPFINNEELTPVDGTLVITNKDDGKKAIGVAIAPSNRNALTAVEGGLFVPQLAAGDGIKVEDNVVSVKLANTTHGLIAVDGELKLNLATKSSDGAMSKEDKGIIESLPEVYVQHKYEVSHKPTGTIVDYREKEIRIMCPADTHWEVQKSGTNASKNKYYIGFKAYAPEGAVSFKEDLAKVIQDDTMYYFEGNSFAGIDEYSRRYSITWIPVAELVNDSWNYFGVASTKAKYLGWYYTVEWYSETGKLISTETIRINLSNEACHNNINTFYGAEEDVATKVETLKKTLTELQEGHFWGEI